MGPHRAHACTYHKAPARAAWRQGQSAPRSPLSALHWRNEDTHRARLSKSSPSVCACEMHAQALVRALPPNKGSFLAPILSTITLHLRGIQVHNYKLSLLDSRVLKCCWGLSAHSLLWSIHRSLTYSLWISVPTSNITSRLMLTVGARPRGIVSAPLEYGYLIQHWIEPSEVLNSFPISFNNRAFSFTIDKTPKLI